MKCTICKRIARDNESNICSKCRGLTLRELIKKGSINPEIFQKQSPQKKKARDVEMKELEKAYDMALEINNELRAKLGKTNE